MRHNMASMFLPFTALYLAVLLLMTGIGLLGTYLPLRMTIEGVSPHLIGIVMSSYFFGMLIGALQCHKLIQSVGHIRSFATFGALATAIVMLHGIHMSPVFWGILRFFCGIATMGLYMVIESWLNECTQSHMRGKVLALYMVITYLGMGVGQQMLNLDDGHDQQMFYIVGLMLTLCLVPVSVTHSMHPQLPEFERFNAIDLFKKAPTGMLGCLSAGLLNSAFYSIGPVFCHQIGLSVSELSLVMTMTIIGGMVLQWPIGIFSDRFDRTLVLALIGLLVTFLSVVIFFAAGRSFSHFLWLMALFGGLTFTLYPVAVARAHDVFEPQDIVPVSSVLLLSYGTGATAGPILATIVMSSMDSPYGLFAYCSAVGIIYSMVTFALRKSGVIDIVAAEDNTDFVVMKNSSPVAAVINPYSEIETEQNDDEPMEE